MRTEDLKTLSQIGRALWIDPERSGRLAAETVAAVSLLDLADETALDKAATALLERAERDGAAVNAEAFGHPFYRLAPEERFILVTLQQGRMSYARVARVMGLTAETVEATAWRLRQHLAAFNLPESKVGRVNVIGVGAKGVSCPDSSPLRPWTQRLLDDEMGTQERLFLQNHMMACERCRRELARARDLYFHVDQLIPRLGRDGVGSLEKVHRASRVATQPMERTVLESLSIFVARREIRMALGALALLLVARAAGKV